ncbi:hypothetical protein [Phreatobacter cathodiphilus]|uniref:Uncharacterized protein n=1 Tax=Phreatobacter cathodiphilus TaxID=1868589 RepID=A0A2S0NCM5_9HYPH|nr:hypothetical protein [Phreatobacter cathodiphilus]AVO45681.1 hypothetical protein C6569_11720 [Phreatobacter cathodiphilus]
MDPKPASTRPGLAETIRAIRIDEAERTGVVVALREADIARLDILHDRLKPVLADIPRGVDLFDVAVTPGATPRLWIDMIAFVEMARDKRSYRFLQDTREGRRVMIESADPDQVAERITAYIARRLIERERLLAMPPVLDYPALPPADLPPVFAAPRAVGGSAPAGEASADPAPAPAPPPAVAREGVRFSGLGAFVLFLLGIAVGIGGVLGLAQFAARF